MNNFNDPYEAEDATLNKKTELPLVWLLPIIALLVSGWLVYKSISEKGSAITINFPTAEGLEVDKTKIKYLDVEVGKVTAITINEDLKTIQVIAQMNSDAEDYLKEKTRFWVVKPQVGLGGVSGLGTLLSGAYIAMKPGEGRKEQHFIGLTTPPLLKTDADGKQFILETSNLGSMRPGTPINFHGISVGEVLSHRLTDSADAIHLTVFINAPYDQFVRKNTRFWMDSGVDLSAGADGFKVRTGPLISLLSGGIAFRASPEDSTEDIKEENSQFQLYETYEQSTQVIFGNTLKYVMYFDGSMRGLTEGAPVQLRGIPIGKVMSITLELDEKTADIRTPVIVELEPDRIKEVNEQLNVSDKDMIDRLIKKGLRAQLQTGSLLTGQLLVDLDFHPKSKIVLTANNTSVYPEFPTTASSLDEFTHSAQIIMDKIAKLPLDELTTEANKTLQSLQGASKAATSMLATANTTLGTADKTLGSAQQALSTLEPGSTRNYELDKLIQELTNAAGSVRQLTDYLEQHPEALIHGKKEE
ncbi:MAG: PqiB family protein [Methylococcaceae bacterium]